MLASRFPGYELLPYGDYLPNTVWPLNDPLQFMADFEAVQSVIEKAA